MWWSHVVVLLPLFSGLFGPFLRPVYSVPSWRVPSPRLSSTVFLQSPAALLVVAHCFPIWKVTVELIYVRTLLSVLISGEYHFPTAGVGVWVFPVYVHFERYIQAKPIGTSYQRMGFGETNTEFSASWQTQLYTNAVSMSDVRKGICDIDSERISIRAGRHSQEIDLGDITDITVGSPPKAFTDDFDDVFGIKFAPGETSRVCFIDHDSQHADIFDYHLFAEIINGASGVVEFGAMKGGQQTDASSQHVQVAINPDRVVFNPSEEQRTELTLGDIVNIQTGSRTVGEQKRDVIKVDYMDEKTRVTSYVSLIETRIQHLLNRYLRKEYAQLQAEISETAITEPETELVIGYYTTQNLEQTVETLTDGNKHEFETIYEQALDHGLVTHPDDGVNLTQKGKMLANTELEVVNT